MENFKIAAQLYTVKDLLKDKSDKEVYDTLKYIRDIGYEAIQISGVGVIDEKRAILYRDTCKELQLDICATHNSLGDFKNIEWIIEYHKMWDCQYIGIGSMPKEYRSLAGAYDFAKECNEIGKKLEAHGMTLIYHNHRFEFEKFEGKTMMELLFELFDPRYVQFEIDTYWIQAGGGNPVDWIYKVDNRMGVIHFKDYKVKDNKEEFAEIGNGNLNWKAIIEACKKTGVVYAAVEQDNYFKENPLASLKESFTNLKNM